MDATTFRRLLLIVALLGAPSAVRCDAPPHLDLQGDPLPNGALARYGTMRLRHSGPIIDVAFSRDGKQLVSVGDDVRARSIRVWEVASGKLRTRIPLLENEEPLRAVFGPDGTLFIVSVRPLLSAWDAQKGRRILVKEMKKDGTAAVCSPDGKTIAIGLSDGKTLILDSSTGTELARLEPATDKEGGVLELTFSPDGKRLAIGHADGKVRLWDVDQKKRLHSFPCVVGGDGFLRGVGFAPDGKSLAVVTDDRVLHFGAASGTAVAGFQSPLMKLANARFTPDGKLLVGLGLDGRVFRWEARTGKPVAETKNVLYEDTGGLAVFDPVTVTAAYVRDTDIHLIDLYTGKHLHEPAEPRIVLRQLFFTGKHEVVCIGDGAELRVWNTVTGKGRKRERILAADGPPPTAMDLSRDGKRVALVDEGGDLRVLEGKKELWKETTPKDGAPAQLCFSPDGALLAACHDGCVNLLDAATGKRRQALAVGGVGVRVCWSPDGRMLAVTDQTPDKITTVWEVATGRKRLTLDNKGSLLVVFSPDSRRIALGGANGVVRILELGKETAALVLAVDGPLQAFVFAPDGSRYAAASGDVMRLWDAEGRLLAVFRGHEADILALAFAPDGRTLVSTSEDGTALVWDTMHPLRPQPPPNLKTPTADLWRQLGDADAARAFQAIVALREKPAETVAFLQGRLGAVKAIEPQRVERLLTDLGSEDFATREKAAHELEAADEQVEAALRAALAKGPGVDTRMRLRLLIEKLAAPPTHPDRLRELRAVEVLEQIGSAEARALLQSLAHGADARLTRAAQAAVQRLQDGGR